MDGNLTYAIWVTHAAWQAWEVAYLDPEGEVWFRGDSQGTLSEFRDKHPRHTILVGESRSPFVRTAFAPTGNGVYKYTPTFSGRTETVFVEGDQGYATESNCWVRLHHFAHGTWERITCSAGCTPSSEAASPTPASRPASGGPGDSPPYFV